MGSTETISGETLNPGSEVISEDSGSNVNTTTDYETVAKEKGWRPKEEFDGDSEGWVGAEEFIKRQPLFDKIKIQNKKLKELEKTVDALAKHYQSNVTQAKERAILDLKSERREAIELGEVTKVEEIDQKIEHVNRIPDPQINHSSIPPEIESFLEEQKEWFNKNEEMTTFATAYNMEYLKKHPGELEASLKETAKAVRKAYPEKFENTRRQSAPPVEGSTVAVQQGGKYTTNRLNSEQKLVYHQLVKVHKQMSHDEYFKSLDEAGYLE